MDTPNTMEIPGRTIEMIRRLKVPAQCVAIDAGGGGKQIVDRLHELGYRCKEVGFGESPTDRLAHSNRRGELYDTLRGVMNPDLNEEPFAIPDEAHMLRQELAIMPLMYDSEGRLLLPPKERTGTSRYSTTCLRELLGRSPDRADSLCLAVWIMITEGVKHFKIDPKRMVVTSEDHEAFRQRMQEGVSEFMRQLEG